MASRCTFPLFNFPFSIELPIPDFPLVDLDFDIDLDLFCPLD